MKSLADPSSMRDFRELPIKINATIRYLLASILQANSDATLLPAPKGKSLAGCRVEQRDDSIIGRGNLAAKRHALQSK